MQRGLWEDVDSELRHPIRLYCATLGSLGALQLKGPTRADVHCLPGRKSILLRADQWLLESLLWLMWLDWTSQATATA